MIRTVGIDIGSQKTIIVADDGEIVRTSTGSVSFPTLIAFKDNAPRNIGDEALSGDTVIPFINLLAGKTVNEIKSNLALTTAKINIEESDVPLVTVTYGEFSESLSTTSLLGFYLCKVCERISQVYGQDVNLAVALTPGPSQASMKSYYDAFAIAGIDTSKVSIIDSSDAIVAAYSRKLNAIKGPERAVLDNKLVALVEVGHVQTTIVIVKVNPVNPSNKDVSLGATKLAVVHDGNLGCLHFDFKLFDHLSKICASKYSTIVEHGSRRGNRLLAGCERLRKLLSQLNEGVITVENLTDNGDVTFSLKRDEFSEITKDLLSRVRNLITDAIDKALKELLSESETTATAITEEDKKIGYVEIFGGGLRMPVLQNILSDIFGQDIIFGAKLDDGSLAIGAALVANRPLLANEAAMAALANLSSKSQESSVDNPLSTILPAYVSSAKIYRLEDVNSGGLSIEQINQARERELAFQVRDQETRQLLAVRNSLESYILEMRSAPKRKFGELIDSRKLNELLDASEGWIWDHHDANLKDYTEQEQSLKTSVNEICKSYFEAVDNDRIEIEKKLEEEAAKAAAEKPEEDDEDHDNRKLRKPDRMRLVVKNKDEGTELFKGGNYRPAAARYHKALTHAAKFFDLSPDDEKEVNLLKATLHLNLAMCYFKLDNLDQVYRNIEDSIKLDPSNAKAYFRRAQYYEAKKEYDKALEDAKQCESMMTTEDKLVKQTIEKLNKEIQKQKEKEKKMWSKAFS